MTTFDRREEAFENMFAHDEEIHFKAVARRARLLAAWAASLLNRQGADADAYADSIIAAMVENGTDEALFARIRGDLHAGGADVADAKIRDQMDLFMAEAVHHVKTV